MQQDKSDLFKNVVRNSIGYYELIDDCRKNMNDFYEKEYYQTDVSLYKKTDYLEDEILYMTNLCKEKECMFKKNGGVKGKLLDIGCGWGGLLIEAAKQRRSYP